MMNRWTILINITKIGIVVTTWICAPAKGYFAILYHRCVNFQIIFTLIHGTQINSLTGSYLNLFNIFTSERKVHLFTNG